MLHEVSQRPQRLKRTFATAKLRKLSLSFIHSSSETMRKSLTCKANFTKYLLKKKRKMKTSKVNDAHCTNFSILFCWQLQATGIRVGNFSENFISQKIEFPINLLQFWEFLDSQSQILAKKKSVKLQKCTKHARKFRVFKISE